MFSKIVLALALVGSAAAFQAPVAKPVTRVVMSETYVARGLVCRRSPPCPAPP